MRRTNAGAFWPATSTKIGLLVHPVKEVPGLHLQVYFCAERDGEGVRKGEGEIPYLCRFSKRGHITHYLVLWLQDDTHWLQQQQWGQHNHSSRVYGYGLI